MAYDVFISYRRQGGVETARLLYERLTQDGYSVSFDMDTLGSCNFNDELLKRAAECRHFIVLLNKGCFNRTLEGCPIEEDWLRRELATALYNRRNVVPVMLPGFTQFPKNLPHDIADVAKRNGPKYDAAYWDAFYEVLKRRFLCKDVASVRATPSVEGILSMPVRRHPDDGGKLEHLFKGDGTALREEIRHVYAKVPRVLPYAELERIDHAWTSAEACLSKGDEGKAARRFLEVVELVSHVTACASPFVMRMVGDGIDTYSPDWLGLATSRALGGDKDYQYGMGTLYAAGLGVPKDSAVAFHWFEQAYEKGSFLAQVSLGAAYLAGDGVKADGAKALELLLPAAKKGQPRACERVGTIYRDGIGVAVDLVEARRWFEQAARAGDTAAMVSLAQILESVTHGEDDRIQALDYYRQAARNDNPLAQRILGERLFRGIGMERDPERARQLCCVAAEAGESEAFVLLGHAAEEGWGCKVDLERARELYTRAIELGSGSGREALRSLDAEIQLEKALERFRNAQSDQDLVLTKKLFEKAALQNHVAAMVRLGFLLERGLGCEIDVRQAVKYYEKAEVLGSLPALVALGKLAFWGYADEPKDEAKAHGYFLKAAERWEECPVRDRSTVSYAFYYLAWIYRDGRGVERNPLLGMRFLLRAALADNIAACRHMGTAYERGQLLPQSQEEANRWYRKALDLSAAGCIDGMDDDAMNAIGYLYSFGSGVEKNPALGVAWLQKSMNLGNVQALRHMGFAFRRGEGVGRDPERSVACFMSAAQRGNADAMSSLAWYYYKGALVERDAVKSWEWAERAAKAGSSRAKELLHRFYRDGDGVDQDFARAREWLLESVDAKDRAGRAALGYYYERGLLQFPCSKDKAFDCYKQAADASNTMGMYNLGRCYLEGTGTAPDIPMGLGWLCQAARQMDEDLYYDVRAADLLVELYRVGRYVAADPARAREWSDKAKRLRKTYGLDSNSPGPYWSQERQRPPLV